MRMVSTWLWYSQFLKQEARWEEAQTKLKEAVKVFEQVGDPAAIARSLINIGVIYDTQGKLEQALDYYERALALREQVGDRAAIADSSTSSVAFIVSKGS